MSNIRSGRLVKSLPLGIEQPPKPDHGVKNTTYSRTLAAVQRTVKIRRNGQILEMTQEEFARWRMNVAQATTARKSCRCHGKCECV